MNHKQTIRQEIGGGYLWSPKRENGGARSQFYENMRLADPGDVVLSFADTWIRHVGVIEARCVTAPKPGHFGAAGAYWAQDGWWLPVMWIPLPKPVRPRDIADQLAPLLPRKHSPFNAIRRAGNQKAYLAQVERAVVEAILGRAGLGLEELPSGGIRVFEQIVEVLDDEAERAISLNLAVEETERLEQVKARRGQGWFRANVSAIEKACRVTGVSNPDLLIASHIKPWRSCTTGAERLDGNNGLMLAPHIDRLFDRGFISFRDDGQILVSPLLALSDVERLGLTVALAKNVGPFTAKQAMYLEYHRDSVFLLEDPDI
ncbi:HNH endonuclease [Azospirillum sp. sgz301742]